MMIRSRYLLSILCMMVFSCSSSLQEMKVGDSGPFHCTASYYADEFHGRPTASGEIFDMNGRTAAHRSLPFGTRLKVTNRENGKSVIVTVTDRGPFVEGRDLDLSLGAAKEIGMVADGTAAVKAEILDRDLRYVKYVRYENLVGQGPLTIQVGSFRQKDNALRLRDILSRSYENVYVSRANVRGDEYFRVCVGKYPSRDAVEPVAKALADEGYPVLVVTYREQA
ncbi:MAG: septal ring lytic transglycosylase RlpA family protein [bacterium]